MSEYEKEIIAILDEIEAKKEQCDLDGAREAQGRLEDLLPGVPS